MTSTQPGQTPQQSHGWFRSRYSLDVRSLALLRIGLALMLLADLWTRVGNITAHYSDLGVLPRAVLYNGILSGGHWSLHTLSGSPVFQGLLFGLAALAAIAMLIGYHTRIAAIASWVLLISMHNRNPLLLSAADDVLRAIMFWAMFLPLGAAYSVDRAMNTATRPVPLRIFSGATVALMVQQCLIYILPAASKTTLLNPALLGALSFVVLLLEWVGPLLLWSPLKNNVCRIVAVIAFVSLHIGFGLTLNLGIFPFLSIVTWLPFLPTSFWEALSQRVYGSSAANTKGAARTGLRIFYDADCGFCKKVVHLIRMLLVLPHTPLATAQSIPEINEAMEKQNSWVIVDWKGQHHYKFEGIAYVVSLSPVFGWFSHVLRWQPIMGPGTHMYEWIATNRRKAGYMTRPFKFKPLQVKTPGWLSAIAYLLILLTVVWNLQGLVRSPAFTNSPAPAVSLIRNIANNRTTQRLNWLSQVTRLDRSWSPFTSGLLGAPSLSGDDGWHVVVGHPAGTVVNGVKEVDVLRPNKALSFSKPMLGDRTRFQKNMQWRTFYSNLNRSVGQKVLPAYGDYLCQWSSRQDIILKDLEIYFMRASTVPPGQEQTVDRELIWEQTCPAQ